MVEDWLHVTLEERKRPVASIFEVITLDDMGELDCTPQTREVPAMIVRRDGRVSVLDVAA